MTFYVYIAENGDQKYPLTLTDLRFMRSDVSFPAQISDEEAESFGFYAVKEAPAPEGEFQTNERIAVFSNGKWVEQWIVTPWTDDQIADANQQKIVANKNIRNKKLSDTDWTQLADVDLTADCKAAFAAYRKELRSIDLLNPVWPEVPEEVWA